MPSPWGAEDATGSRSQREDTYPIDEERWVVRAGRGKKQLKRQPLEFGTKYDEWQKPAET